MTVIEAPDSRIAENILLFCRTLRQAGLPIGSGQLIDAGSAVLQTGIDRRDDFRTALRAVLVTDPAQFALFDQAFHLYFRNPKLLERMLGLLLPTLQRTDAANPGETAIRRLLEAMSTTDPGDSDEVVIEVDRAGSWSRREILRDKDFEQMTLDELGEAKQMLRDAGSIVRKVATRRYRADSRGHRFDLRKSMHRMLKNDGQLVELARRRRRTRPRALVLLCDISGSMSRYSRMFMHFAHALSSRDQVVHTFVFGTRLTNVSRWLRHRDVDKALARIAVEARDWDGGTRIADSLAAFNVDWSRRVLAARAVVVLLSDGLERDSERDLAFEAARLRRSADELIWLNPMLRFEQFEAKAGGMKALLPQVDRFLPAHNVSSLVELGTLLASAGGREKAA